VQQLDLVTFEQANLNCDIDTFMEVLINNIRNDCCSLQGYLIKERGKKFKEGLLKLRDLKGSYADNADAIADLESKLNQMADADLRTKLEKYSAFEFLSDEKITPKFLKLARSGEVITDMSIIKDDAGNDFPTDNDRKNFITSYYSNIYKEHPGRVNAGPGCVADFLGPEIVNSPEVINSKVPDNLKNDLERELSLPELDRALEKMRNNSAGGPDGLSVKFIKKFWYCFRGPLKKYVSFCVQKGSLSHTFATAAIKLIPKKGEANKIKNWRPISLLNVLYKVAAKAINNRLKKVAPYCLSRSQKGFVDKRYIQECLINIVESVNFAEKTKTAAFCLAIDQSKAFDSVSHEFLKDVYRFFGFGENFIQLITVLTTGRTASIMFDDGTKGPEFPLECGNAQGNSPSPLQFNLADQILIFKIEGCRLIKSIMTPRSVRNRMSGERAPDMPPPPLGPDQQQREGEVAPAAVIPGQPVGVQLYGEGNIIGKKDKLEAFADDGTILARAEEQALAEIKNILNQFASVSGLKCNMEKSTIMLMGFNENLPVPEWILNSGFKIVNITSVLGCDISKNAADLPNNFDKIIGKIAKIKRFWERFNLSLPGRLAVAKSLMLSQISYLACVIDPNADQISVIKKSIYDFVQGRLIVARDKITLNPSHGGLGMIDIDTFIIAQQCSWLKRLHNGSDDTYKEILRIAGCDDLEIFDPAACNKNTWPLLGGIWDSICKFYEKFASSDNNWEKIPVLFNPLLPLNREKNLIGTGFFMHNLPPISKQMAKLLKTKDCWKNGRLKSLDEINQALPVQFSLASYLRLSGSSRYWDKRALQKKQGNKVCQFRNS
jgi:hypothetical protein